MNISVQTEWDRLTHVIVGHGLSMGDPPTVEMAYDPTSRQHIRDGTYPTEGNVAKELDGLARALHEHGVDILRPIEVEGLEQVFTRDVGLVIEDVFFRSRMIEGRKEEWTGIEPLLDRIKVEDFPDGMRVEGGDVLLLDGAIAIGVTRDPKLMDKQTARTVPSAAEFLRDRFPNRQVIEIELHKDDHDPLRNALHLDCAYMPLGGGEGIFCPDAFLYQSQLNELKKRHIKCIEISLEEGAQLQSNLVHINPTTLLIDPRFDRLSRLLESRGYTLVECPLGSVGRMGGLFRCSTLPLHRLS